MNRFKRVIYHINKLRWWRIYESNLSRRGRRENFESYDENVSDLLAILKETKGIKIRMVEYKVLKYELNYFRHPKKRIQRESYI